jgi:hypothetical protein
MYYFHLLALKPNLEIFSIYSGRWFSPGTPTSSTTKTGRHDIAESGAKHQKINQSIIFFKKLFSLISLHRIQFYLSQSQSYQTKEILSHSQFSPFSSGYITISFFFFRTKSSNKICNYYSLSLRAKQLTRSPGQVTETPKGISIVSS